MAVKFVTTSEVARERREEELLEDSDGSRGHLREGVLAPLRCRNCLHKSAIPMGGEGRVLCSKGICRNFALPQSVPSLACHAPHGGRGASLG